MEFVFLGLFFVFLFGLIYWAIRYAKKVNQRKQGFFVDFASKHGLTHTAAKHFLNSLNHVKGQIKGMDFVMTERIVGSGKHQQVWLDIQFYNSGVNFDFKIGKEHLFSKAGKLFGKEDILMNDEEFDKLFLLKSSSENQLKDLLTYDIQKDLKSIHPHMQGKILSENGVVTYSIIGSLANQKAYDSAKIVIEFIVKLLSQRR